MPSLSKVRVSNVYGAGAQGEINPSSGMSVRFGPYTGTVVATGQGPNGAMLLVKRGTGNIEHLHYPKDLVITYDHATGLFSYPTGDGSVVWGHLAEWPSGVTRGRASGMVLGLSAPNQPLVFYP